MERFARFQSTIKTDVPLAMHTWLQLGGRIEYFAEPKDEDELVRLIQEARQERIPIRVLGTGTNILVADEGVPGMAIRLSAPAFCQIEPNAAQETVTAGGGAKLGRVITSAVYEGLAGLEGLIGIPGTVGGAVRKNISASDGNIGEWIESVRVILPSGETADLSKDELVIGEDGGIEAGLIVSCRFKLVKEDAEELSRRLQKIWILRKKTEPMGYQGAGRLFKDPIGQTAAQLIDEAGLRGTRIGGAVISDRNPNFVLVDPDSSSDDVRRLIRLIQTQVRERSEVDLEPDIVFWQSAKDL